MPEITTEAETFRKIDSLIKGIHIAMLTTVAADSSLHSRPMATQAREFDGAVWFFSSDDSGKVHELIHNRSVNVAYSNPTREIFLSLSGKGELVFDKEKISELWTSDYTAWFPDGLEDPHLALIKVSVETAQYWEGPSPGVQWLRLAKALVTGNLYEGVENRKVDLKKTA